jgi:large subunit ribosomal protein L5
MDKGLKEIYQDQVVPKMMNQFGLDNPLMVPKIVKVVVNIGLGEATQNQAVIEKVMSYLALITGQRGMPTLARKSISGFKLRKGQAIGVKVTLRRKRMYAFLERLLRITLPRTRDFQGLSVEAFDASGNYTIGLPEQLVFPELNLDQIDKPRGLEVSIVTDTPNPELAQVLLEELGFPFKKGD